MGYRRFGPFLTRSKRPSVLVRRVWMFVRGSTVDV